MLLLCSCVCYTQWGSQTASQQPSSSFQCFSFFFFFFLLLFCGLVSSRRSAPAGGAVTLHPPQKIRLPMKYIKKRKKERKRRRWRKEKKKKCKVIGCNPYTIKREIRKGRADSSGILEMKTNKNMTLLLLYYSQRTGRRRTRFVFHFCVPCCWLLL